MLSSTNSPTTALLLLVAQLPHLLHVILIILTILEFAVALIQAYVLTLLVSLYLHDNSNDPPNSGLPYS